MPELLWNRLTAAELRGLAKKGAIVLLPVASTEQHGPHLATGVDSFLCGEGCLRAARLVARKKPIVVAPTLWVGLAEHHVAFGGTFTLSLSTYYAVIRELCESILRAGFKKILIVNGHGGNIAALTAMTTDLARDLKAPIATTTLYALPHEAGAYEKILDDQKGVMHACEAETSMMMAAFPGEVRKNKLKAAKGPMNVAAPGRAAVLVWRSFAAMTKSGVVGDARKANAAKGEKLLNVAAELLAAKLLKGAPWT